MKKLNENKNTIKSRRSFLKKTAYHAPSLLLMGQLTKPTLTHGASPIGTPSARSSRPVR
jgi:hypothetical protein